MADAANPAFKVGEELIEEALPHGSVLIMGGGPVGLILATILAYYGVKSVILERNETTTK
jgi:FAD-dependent monooxygenase